MIFTHSEKGLPGNTSLFTETYSSHGTRLGGRERALNIKTNVKHRFKNALEKRQSPQKTRRADDFATLGMGTCTRDGICSILEAYQGIPRDNRAHALHGTQSGTPGLRIVRYYVKVIKDDETPRVWSQAYMQRAWMCNS